MKASYENLIDIKLFCPLCGKELEVNSGWVDNSGGSGLYTVYCICGFQFTPPIEKIVEVGESGWDYIYRRIKQSANMLIENFKGE